MALRRVVVLTLLVAGLLAGAAPAHAARLRAGVGRADITPQTGYYLGGWTRADRTSHGQHTRLFASALVLQQGERKVALVATDLFMVPGGMVRQAADMNAAGGFSERNVVVSASHTHSGPGGYANFKTFNTAAPSLATATDPFSFYRLLDPKPADPQLYTFLTRRLATAIRRANANLGPAMAGWGSSSITGLTQNRSVEAHLADHGLVEERGRGRPGQDPGGAIHTIDPAVNVLRVDKVRRHRRIPIGGWSTFADHGTVTKSSFQYYNEDHHASAKRVFEATVRREGRVPRRQPVLNVFGNSDEGDQSAGLTRSGPAASDYVGRVEASAMLKAWRRARRGGLSRRLPLDLRWTRVCFCGQSVEGGTVASNPMIGIPFLTGSEEERGPLFDVTHVPFEGRRNPLEIPTQGHKVGIPLSTDNVPKAVPLAAVRLGSRMIVTMPGEPTKEVGERIRAAVASAARGSPVGQIVVSGLANEYIQYFTTPQEYDRQHYEGGATLYGPLSAPLLTRELAELGRRLVGGQPPQPAYPFDPTAGVRPDGPPYGDGAAASSLSAQPARRYERLQHASIAWQGGPRGLDRPVDRAFVIVQRRAGRRWRTVTSDLGLQILWTVDGQGAYRAMWEIPLSARRGIYRLVVRGKRYRLASRRFRVVPTDDLGAVPAAARPGRVAVGLTYPAARRDVDITYRPPGPKGGRVTFRIGSRRKTVRRRTGSVFSVRAPAGRSVSVPAGAGRDRYGNRNGAAVTLRR